MNIIALTTYNGKYKVLLVSNTFSILRKSCNTFLKKKKALLKPILKKRTMKNLNNFLFKSHIMLIVTFLMLKLNFRTIHYIEQNEQLIIKNSNLIFPNCKPYKRFIIQCFTRNNKLYAVLVDIIIHCFFFLIELKPGVY